MSKFLPPRTTTATRTTHIPLKGELLFDIDLDRLFVGDGVTVGGIEVSLGGATGDMLKGTYDTDNDGVVDQADLAHVASSIVGTPAPLNYYGTNNLGSKGFFSFPTGTGGSVNNADNLDNKSGSFYLNRSNHLGTQPINTISGLGTSATKNFGTLTGELLLLTEDNKLPILDGSNLINLPRENTFVPPNAININTSVTLNNTHNNSWLLVSGNSTITVPSVSFGVFYCTVQNISATTLVTIAGIVNLQVDVIRRQWDHCVIYSDGISWYCINESRGTQTLAKYITANYTLLNFDYKYWIKASNTITVTVQPNPSAFFEVIIQNVGIGVVTIDGIPDSKGNKLSERLDACHLYYDGVSWTAVGALSL